MKRKMITKLLVIIFVSVSLLSCTKSIPNNNETSQHDNSTNTQAINKDTEDKIKTGSNIGNSTENFTSDIDDLLSNLDDLSDDQLDNLDN